MGMKFNPVSGEFDLVASPGGSTTQIQFNDAGIFGGDADLTWNKTTNILTNAGTYRAGIGSATNVSYGFGGATTGLFGENNDIVLAAQYFYLRSAGTDYHRFGIGNATYFSNGTGAGKRTGFGGNTSPSAKIHIAAGEATASGAPFKLTAGTHLTTPEAGAIEYDGTDLYYTDGTPTRHTLATTADTFWEEQTGAYTALTQKTNGTLLIDSGTNEVTPYTVTGISPNVNFVADYGNVGLNVVGISSHGSGGFFDLGSLLFFNRGRGTTATPLALQNGDYIGGQVFGGYGSGDYQLGLTGMLAIAIDDWDISPGALDLRWVMNATTVFSTAGDGTLKTTASYDWQFDALVGIADGSAAAPSLMFSTDTTTGAYQPADDQFGITAGGVSTAIFSDGISSANFLELAPTDRTITSIQSFIALDNIYTLNFATAITPPAFNVGSTFIFAQNGYGLASGLGFYMHPTIQNDSGSTRTMGPWIGVASIPTYQANGGSLTIGSAIDNVSQGIFNRINAGTTTATNHYNYWAQGGTVDTGATVTNRFGFTYTETGTINGTLTNSAAFVSVAVSGTNKTHFLIGTATIPSGTWGIYQSSTETNFFSGDINFVKEAARTIQMTDTTTAATAGAALTILGAAGSNTTSGTGGAISVTSGAGRAGNAGGGALNLTGGAGVGVSSGGHVNITGGAALTGGTVIINGGNGVADGNVRLVATDGMVQVGHASTPGAMMDIRGRIAATDTLSVDNLAIAANIAIFKDNGTAVWTIADGGNLTAGEGINIVAGTTTGTKIGTATTQKLGFWNATPVVQDTGWSVTNETTDKSFDADATTVDEIADVLGTLIETLKTYGILGA